MFGFFKKKEEIKTTTITMKTDNPLANMLREKYQFIFAGDISEEEFNKNTQFHALRKRLPVDIQPDQILAFKTYKSATIGFYITEDKGFGFYLLKRLPIGIFASLTRKNKVNQESGIYLSKDLNELIQIDVVDIDDIPYISKVVDTYFQKYLELIVPSMRINDKIVLNRNGMSLELKPELDDKSILVIMSLILQAYENFVEHEPPKED